MTDDTAVYQYRFRTERAGQTKHTPWVHIPIDRDVLREWREDIEGCDVFAERRAITYGEAETFEP